MSEPAIELLLSRLRALVGAARLTSCVDAVDRDPRTAEHISGRSIGKPLAWVRPETTESCAEVCACAHALGFSVVPVGDATTFWDPLRVDRCVLLDVCALQAPFEIDVLRRLAWVGGGVSLRAIDEAARREGLALASYPDTDGDTTASSVLAVGTTAGLGLGLGAPIEYVSGARVVRPTGAIVRVGASTALGATAFARDGVPTALSTVAASEGRAGVITELGFRLVRARPLVCAMLQTDRAAPRELAHWLGALLLAREAIDEGALDSARIELLADRGARPRCDLLLRTHAPHDVAEAEARARLLAAGCVGFSLASITRIRAEQSAGRFSLPPKSHRARLAGLALWGVEVSVSWGDELEATIAQIAALFDALEAWSPLHRRVGVYPSSHAVTVGTQVLFERQHPRIDEVRHTLEAALPALLARGAVPYRGGALWRAALDAHPFGGALFDPVDGAMAPWERPR